MNGIYRRQHVGTCMRTFVYILFSVWFSRISNHAICLPSVLFPFSVAAPMPLPSSWLPCPFSSSAACCAADKAAENCIRPGPNNPVSSDSSRSSKAPRTSSTISASGFEDNVSLQTLPSLPSIHSLNPPHFSPSVSTSFLFLSALYPRGRANATALAVDPSTQLLYSASEAEIVVYDLADLSQIDSFASPTGAGSLKSVTLSPDGGRVFTAHQDGRIRVWRRSASSGRHHLLATLPTATDRMLRLPLPSNYVTVRRHKKRLWIEHTDAVTAVAARDGLLYSVSWDRTLKVWRGSDLRCLESAKAHEDAVNAVVVAADGTVYTGSADRRIRVWGRGPGERRHVLVATLEKHRSAVNALALSADGSVLYSGACDRSILVWEREESANYMVVVGALRGHERAILCLAFAGELLFSGSSDRTVRIWRTGGDGKGYSCLGVMEGHVSGVRSLTAVRTAGAEEDEYRVCSGSLDGEVRVWRVIASGLKKSDSSSLSVTEN